jgi:hypothetical protein
MLDSAAEIVRSIDPGDVNLEMAAGILEGYALWGTYRIARENPFEHLLDQACLVVFDSLKAIGNREKVFAVLNGRVDVEFNLMLGEALLVWAENRGDESWAALARSLILSVLSLGENSINAAFLVTGTSEAGEIVPDPSSPLLSAARLYRILNPVFYCPRALSIGPPENGMWVWTAASAISVSQVDGVLDISVSFPPGETHYLIIRGIRAIERVQLYGVNFPTDPQFEQYDFSGWAYTASEQALTVKMKHRVTAEHIRITFAESSFMESLSIESSSIESPSMESP